MKRLIIKKVYLKSGKSCLTSFWQRSPDQFKLGGSAWEIDDGTSFWVETIWVVKDSRGGEKVFPINFCIDDKPVFSKAEKRVQELTVFWKSLKTSHFTKFNFCVKNLHFILHWLIYAQKFKYILKIFLARKFKCRQTCLLIFKHCEPGFSATWLSKLLNNFFLSFFQVIQWMCLGSESHLRKDIKMSFFPWNKNKDKKSKKVSTTTSPVSSSSNEIGKDPDSGNLDF